MIGSKKFSPSLALLSLLLVLLIGTRAGGTLSRSNSFRGVSLQKVDSLTTKPSSGVIDSTNAPSTKRIYIEQVDLWRYDKDSIPGAQVLTGNVVFRHKNAYMYCDSALLYEDQNRFEAYGEVRIDQAEDSLHIYCNYLDYDGNTMVARLRYLVRMEQGQTTLYTDSLDYDRLAGLGYYFDNGSIVDSLNILNSVYGEYDTESRTAMFSDDVELENENFTLYSDTLFYDTNTHIATILGPTKIVSDSGVINATRGTYDTEQEVANLLDRATITSKSQWMTGDSLYYNRLDSIALLFGQVILRDTTQKVELRGNYIEYHEDSERGLARDSALLVEYSSSDTLWAASREMEMWKVDSLNRVFSGRGNVRLYRSNAQAVSDSLVYLTKDSLINFLGNPFIWSGKSQVTGDSITFFLKDSTLDYAHIRQNAYLAAEVSEGPRRAKREDLFNQLKGREVKAYFSGQALDSVLTEGNAEVIYYNQSTDSLATEQVKSQSSAILMQFEDEEISRILMRDKTTGEITPVPLLSQDMMVYPKFIWFPEGRPTSKMDLYRTTPTPGSGMSQKLQEVSAPTGSLFSDSIPTPADSVQPTEKEKITEESKDSEVPEKLDTPVESETSKNPDTTENVTTSEDE